MAGSVGRHSGHHRGDHRIPPRIGSVRLRPAIRHGGRGRLETKVVRGSKTVGRDVKKGLGRAGRTLDAGAPPLARDVRTTGRKGGAATKRGWARAGKSLKRNRST